MSDLATIQIKDLQGDQAIQLQLVKLFVTHQVGGLKVSKEKVDELANGSPITVSIPRDSLNPFFQGLNNYSLQYEIQE